MNLAEYLKLDEVRVGILGIGNITPQNPVGGHIKGAISWLQDIKKMVDYGNYKDALQGHKNLMKNLPALAKEIKKLEKAAKIPSKLQKGLKK